SNLVASHCLAIVRQGKPAPAPGDIEGLFMKNALVEVRVLHARNLIEFMCSGDGRADDLKAALYFNDWSAGDETRLKALAKRAHKELAHLTTTRVTDAEHSSGAKSKGWPPSEFNELLTHCRRFVDQLFSSDWLNGAPAELVNGFELVRSLLETLS